MLVRSIRQTEVAAKLNTIVEATSSAPGQIHRRARRLLALRGADDLKVDKDFITADGLR